MSKNVGAAVETLEENSNHERKAKWDRLGKIQKRISSSFTKLANGACTVSVTQHQDAKEEGRECKGTANKMPWCSKITGHCSLASNSASKYASTPSEPRNNALPECYSIARVHLALIKSDMSQMIDNEDKG